MTKRLVLAGAGHAHVMILDQMPELVRHGLMITVIGPAALHYYSGMGPGMLGGAYSPESISFPVRSMVERTGATFIEDYVTGLDPKEKFIFLKSGKTVKYDVVSFNTGSEVPDDIVEKGAEDVFSVKPIENLWQGRQRLLELAAKGEVRVGVVGGGPGALEVAGNAWAAGLEKSGKGARVRIYGGRKFLHKLPQGVQKRARQILSQRGIEIIEGQYAQKVGPHRVTMADNNTYEEEIIFTALGVRPRPLFAPSGLSTGKDGGLLVNRFLQNPEYPEIFGGGDCIWFEAQPLDKVGVYAVRQNPVLLHNVRAAFTGEKLMPFNPGGDYLLIFNLGQGRGILHKKGFVIDGRMAFWLKDYIDRKFIKKFKPED